MMMLSMYRSLAVLSLAAAVLARPTVETLEKRQANVNLKNGQDAIALNNRFKTLTANSPCTAPEDACLQDGFAQCVGGRFVRLGCAAGTVCAALPNVGTPGTSVACTSAADRDARISATGANAAAPAPAPPAPAPPAPAPPAPAPPANNGDPQKSLTLDPAVIAKGFENNGQAVPEAGQVPSLTSSNNFINFCKTVNQPITNGAQVVDGSCNPAPMGQIPAKARMTHSKFTFPQNTGKVAPGTRFTIRMAIRNLESGNFVNAQQNYFSAPQQLNGQGIVKGHSHVVIQKLDSLTSTAPLDPTVFAFFKGLNGAAVNGELTADVTDGLPEGVYRLFSINTAANHQPVLVPVAQHGALDDAIYFTVGA